MKRRFSPLVVGLIGLALALPAAFPHLPTARAGSAAQDSSESANSPRTDTAAPPTTPAPDLRTIAESSGFTATATSEESLALLDRLVASSAIARRVDLGKTGEGNPIAALVLSDPPVASVDDAERERGKGKLVVMAIGNIHAGEVCGKEALPMLAREVLDPASPAHALLKDLVIVFVPNFNADGNDRMSADNRPGQVGPEKGMGERENAAGMDLNRDFVKLETPEGRVLARAIRRWDPSVFVDTHTTNGSLHRYLITYAGPKHPAGDAKVIEFSRTTMMPELTRRLRERTGIESFWYGNFAGTWSGGQLDHSRWESFPAEGRYLTNMVGLRNRLSVLCEAYSYAPYKDRVEGTREFLREILVYAAEQKEAIRTLMREADERTTAAGREPKADDATAVRTVAEAYPDPVKILGYVEKDEQGKLVPGEPTEYEALVVDRFRAEAAVRRPFAYVFGPEHREAVMTLQRHGVRVDELREDIDLEVEVGTVTSVQRADREYQGHQTVRVETSSGSATKRYAAGTIVVRLAQPLGSLAVVLLEAGSEDGLVTWNAFERVLREGAEYPVARVAAVTPMLTRAVRPMDEDREFAKPIDFESYKAGKVNLSGSPMGLPEWLDDDHYRVDREGASWKVHAATGKAEKIEKDRPKLKESLGALSVIGTTRADEAAGRARAWTADRSGALVEFDADLYFARADGSPGVRLTASPEREELAELSPSGAFVAFVRANDLWVVDIATQRERALTTGGNDTLRRGKHDWVYFEELFGRSWKAYWWSPDSTRILFFENDSSQVETFTITNDLADVNSRQNVETEKYPKPGEANPSVRVGIVSVSGGAVAWTDLEGAGYDFTTLYSGAGWKPDSSAAYVFAQNREQTWLDICTIPARSSTLTRVLRDQTPAWTEAPDILHWLDDGSLLLSSERSGWKHLYHYNAGGELIRQVTGGDFEVRSVLRLDQKNSMLFVTATKDSPIASNTYRVKLDGSDFTRLTPEPGSHSVSVNPAGTMLVDSFSDHANPTRVVLRGADTSVVRRLDTNPVYEIEEFRRGEFSMLQVPMSDGFVLEGCITKPPGFDPRKKYPVWLMTYAGPHAPTVSDSWSGGRTYDQVLAAAGFVVFRTDPRSASGKGAVSAWKAYKRLGPPELKDLEEAVAWLAKEPWIDASRVGISGFSYGGFMTAYALTHSKTFAAGIAGAPVLDWRDYDSIYTERYMLTPQSNPEGYAETSVVAAAKDLHGKLLLVHGTIDDNVHLQNSTRFVRALQDANKTFEMMLYPGFRHGIFGDHYQNLNYDFIVRTLGDPKPPAGAAPAPMHTN